KWAIRKNKDGSFTITNKKSGMNLAVAGGKAKNGANIQTAKPSGAKAQKFNFLRRAVLADGIYVLHPKTAQTTKALDIAGAAVAQGAKAWVYDCNNTAAQRFMFKHLGNSIYSIQSVVSGKYLADANGKLVQRAFKGNALSKAQQWKVEVRGSGITLTNVATGKTVATPGSVAKNKVAFVTRAFSGKGTEKFRPMRCSSLIDQGLYTFESVSARQKMLDVVGGTWANKANAQIYRNNGTNAQKFALVPAGNGYYRILMVLSGNDALAGAAHCGKNKAVLILADVKNSAAAEAFVKANKANIQYGYVFGGDLAVPVDVMTKLEKASL
ncbi:MAG: RICIN domain-containing protein, partial [Eggerthellaceae bacterium]|nr:RICIN domain-containing protein [Eggerthellaceae bacterium]